MNGSGARIEKRFFSPELSSLAPSDLPRRDLGGTTPKYRSLIGPISDSARTNVFPVDLVPANKVKAPVSNIIGSCGCLAILIET
jgi:hypothetical protein